MEDEEKQAMSQRIQELEKELAALKAARRTGNQDSDTPSTSTGASGGGPIQELAPVIYVQQERKLPLFSGKVDCKDSWTLDEWIEQIRLFAQARGRSEKERAQIVFDHLEGAARTEVKFLPTTQRESMESIFDVLKDVYGSVHSHINLQRRFYNRKQNDGESVIDYSHALMDLMDMITKNGAQAASVAASKDLRDQFCDGIRDPVLKIRLRDLVNTHPNWTIREARAEATRWIAQCGGQPRLRNSEHSASNEMVASCDSALSGSTQYNELMSLLKAQQSQLDLVMKALAPQNLPPGRTRYTRPRRSADGKPICFKCEQSGHIARNCPNAKSESQATPKPMGN